MISVFGATGKVGGKVAAILLEAGIPVRILARSEEKAAPLKNEGAEVVIGSMLNIDDVKNALDRCDGAFLMTPGNYTSENYIEEEIQIGKNYVEALKDSAIGHIVCLSVWKVREKTGIPFFDSKEVIEDALLTAGVECTFIRPASFMENLFALVPTIKQQNEVHLPVPGDVEWPMVATEDVAYVAAQSLMRGGRGKIEAYDILGLRDYTMNEITSDLSIAIAKPISYQEVTFDQVRQVLSNMGLSHAAIDGYIAYFAAIPKMKVEGDRNLVYNEFNFEPTAVETFLDTIVGALLAEPRQGAIPL